MSCSCHEFGNCVTLFLPAMPPTSCSPKNSELHWLHGMVDSLLLRATPPPSSSSNSTIASLTHGSSIFQRGTTRPEALIPYHSGQFASSENVCEAGVQRQIP